MKNIKALFTLVLALIMTVSLATTAFAAKITIDDGDVTGAEYSAYKLLNATEGENDNFAYTVNPKYRAALQTATGKTTDEEIVAYIATLTAAEDIRAFADEIYELIKGETAEYVTTTNAFENIDQGYYLIEESKVGSAEGYDKDTVSLVMLDTAGLDEIEITTKEELPTSEKKVKDKNDTTGDVTDWQDSADYDIGDAVPFKITFVLPGDFGVYESYFVGIHDVQAEGLTYNNDLKVSVGEDNLTGAFTYTAAPENCENGCTFHIQCADIIAYAKANGITLEAGDAIVFEYTSTLNENAVLGSTGNPNEMTIEFSNNPYGDGTSETPKDRVIVFTYKVNVDKFDEKNVPLTGAEFTLYKEVTEGTEGAQTGADIKATFAENVKAGDLDDAKFYILAATVETDADGDTFGFKGVDDGTYVLVETKIPDGYNAWDAESFEITAEHDVESDDPQLTTLTGGDLFTGDVSTGILDTDIVNETGIELPSTGGIGTTIFYVVGGLLAVAAIVLLVTKKRMANGK